jgi:hypothetical protein
MQVLYTLKDKQWFCGILQSVFYVFFVLSFILMHTQKVKKWNRAIS